MAIPSLAADPCGRAAALRAVYDQIVSGGKVVEAEFEAGNGVRQRVKYSDANVRALQQEIAAADRACNTTGRYAIGGRMS